MIISQLLAHLLEVVAAAKAAQHEKDVGVCCTRRVDEVAADEMRPGREARQQAANLAAHTDGEALVSHAKHDLRERIATNRSCNARANSSRKASSG